MATSNGDDFEFDVDALIENLTDPSFKVPDLMEAVEGWRSWRVSGEIPKRGQHPKLYSVSHGGYYWKPRKESVATCERGCGEDVPGESCTCGFYTARDREHLMQMGYQAYDGERNGSYCVIGKVANWGKVIEGTQGWRAQKAYPVELYVPFEIWKLAKPLSETYGVPVKLNNFLRPQKAR